MPRKFQENRIFKGHGGTSRERVMLWLTFFGKSHGARGRIRTKCHDEISLKSHKKFHRAFGDEIPS